MNRRQLYEANLEAARNRRAAADAAFVAAMTTPWWQPWKSSRLLNEAEELLHQAVVLYEDNVVLAYEIEGGLT